MSARFIEAKDVARLEFPGIGVLGMLSEPIENENVLFGDLIFAPGDGFDFHHHPDQAEALYLIDGSLEAWIDQERRTLNPGDTMWLPARPGTPDGEPPASVVLRALFIPSEAGEPLASIGSMTLDASFHQFVGMKEG